MRKVEELSAGRGRIKPRTIYGELIKQVDSNEWNT